MARFYRQVEGSPASTKSAFDSELKNTTMSDEDYAYCQDVWRTENMQTMYDFLKWYNNRDVGPFVEAIEKQMDIYKNVGLDMFRDGISVPGLCMKLLFKRLDSATYFTLYGERDKDLYHTVKNNVVGGPSIIFHRYHEEEFHRIVYDYIKIMLM